MAESLRDAVTQAESGAATTMPIALLQGSFRGVHHDGMGTATVYRLDDDTRVLRLTDFEIDNGPDLYVYLVASTDAPDNDTVERAGFVSLGPLKGNKGDQNYVIPADLDVSSYRAVSIWCKRFGVNFTTAALSHIMMPASVQDAPGTGYD